MSHTDVLAAFSQLGFMPFDWLLIELAIVAAYIVFGVAGFGTALVAGPILIHFMPLSRIIPLLVMLDFLAAFGNLLPSRQSVVRSELMRLLPCMAAGCTLGVLFLLNLKSDLLLLLMGLFVTGYAVYSLAVKVRPTQLAAGGRSRQVLSAGCSGLCLAAAAFFMRFISTAG
ncbi:hypothetical protein CVE24_17260 [Pseudomonas syringae pv. actinidiae]|nr:hypothetical protein [Pseudomonas syringae pv. actinidiae]